ncbi:MAG: hypothetical protein M1830_002707 [Pleopsidium flavum]|nr:MAG: hypothetical protein M1830_002707 [Pleopsidium flavum]
MAALRVPALRYIIGGNGPVLRGSQRRWAQVHDVRFVATHREPDRILERYKEKLDRKAKEQGLRDVNELKEAYKSKIHNLRAKINAAGSNSPASTSPFPQPPPPPQPISSPTHSPSTAQTPSRPTTPPGIKTLSSYIDIPKTLALPPKEIEYIWRLRHASSKTSLCAVIPTQTYTQIERTARRHPQFILPLPREGQGAEIHFLQWTFPTPTTTTVLFTHLAEYKLRGEYSQPHTTVTLHLELAGPKGLVLVQGSVVEGRGVSVEEGRWLVMCLQKFYGVGEERGERRRLLEQFSHGDGGFKVEELLEEAEKI